MKKNIQIHLSLPVIHKTLLLPVMLALGICSATAATAIKSGTGTDLTGVTTGVWSGGGGANGSPTNTDIATWNTSSLGAGLTLAASRPWAGISVSSAATDIIISGAGTLTCGANGIDLSGALKNLAVNNPVAVGANQNWNEGPGIALTVSGVVSGSFGVTNNSASGSASTLAYGAFLPATATTNLMFTGVSLASVTNAGGLVGGGYVNSTVPLVGTAFYFSNSGTTATYQLQAVDGSNTKCVKVQLTQANGNIYGTVLYAKYDTSANFGENFDSAGTTGTIATVPAGAGYGAALTTLQLSSPVTVAGVLCLNGLNTFTGGLTVNGGTVLLVNGAAFNGGAGCIGSGPLTVGSGGTVNTLTAFAIGGNAGNQTVNVNGGTFSVGKADYFKTINMTGGTINVNLTGIDRLRPVNASSAGGTINTLASASVATIASTGGGVGVDIGPLTFNVAKGSVSSGIDLLVNSPINQNGGGGGAYAVTKTGAGTLVLAGANSYTAATAVNGGTLLLNGSGSSAVNVAAGATFGGAGTNNAAVTLNSGSTLAAAIGATNAGALTINGTLTLNTGSTNFMRISKTGGILTNDLIKGMSGLAYAGTLIVTNITSDNTPLAAGDSFTLYAKGSGSYSGGFTTTVLPGLPAGFTWDLSQLSVSGTISVANTAPQPTFTPVAGGYIGAQTVVISSSISGATIYYTTDGSTPTTGSSSYSTPITVALNTTVSIKAFVHASGYADSPVVTAVYSTLPWATWTNNIPSASWAQAANWSNNVIGNGSGSLVDFSTVTLTANTTVTLDSFPTAGNLIFADQGNTYNWNITNGAGGTLTLQSPAGTSTINVSNTATTLGVVLAGTNSLTKTGNGLLTLAGANSFSGGLTVSNGSLQLGKNAGYGADASAVGSGQLTISSGATAATTVPFGISGKYGSGNTRVVNIAGTLNLSASEYVRTWSLTGGALVAPGTATEYLRASTDGLSINSKASATTASVTGNIDLTYNSLAVDTEDGPATNDLTISGNITENTGAGSGSKTLTKTGAGSLVLSGVNRYTGATTVSNGTLLVNSPGSLAAGSAAIVKSGAVLGGDGVINGPVTLNSGGTLVAGTNNLNAGTNGSVGMLTINNQLTLDAGSTNFMRVSKTGGLPVCDLVTGLTGTLTYAGTLVISDITSDGTLLAAGDSFTLFTKATGAYAGGFSTVLLPALASGLSWDVSQLTVNGTVSIVNAVATPTFTPSAGGYIGAQLVTISCVTPGAIIYYTTDGSTPTPGSPVYSTPIAVPVNTNITIQAYAVASGFSDSPVATANYITETEAVWTTVGDGSWTGSYNWTNNIIPNASGVTADFSTLTLTANTTVTLDGPQTAGNLVLGDMGSNYNWNIDAGSGGALTLAGSAPTISVANQTATIGAVLAGTDGLTKSANGTLVLTNANTYTGNTVVAGGTLKVDGSALASSTAALASAKIINSAAVVFYRGAAGYIPAPALSGAGDYYVDGPGGGTMYDNRIIFRGTNSDNTGTVWVTNGGKLWVDRAGAAVGTSAIVNVGPSAQFYIFEGISETIGGLAGSGNVYGGDTSTGPSTLIVGGGDRTANFSGSAQNGSAGNILTLTKIGAGTQTLSGANTYTGATVVSNGTLLVNGSLASGSAVTVAGGTLGGNGTIADAVAVNGILAPGTNGSGTLTIGGALTLNPNSTTTFAVNGSTAANTAVALGSTVAYGGILNIVPTGTFTAGQTFTLFSGAGAASAGNFASITGSPGGSLNFSFTNGVLSVVNPMPTPAMLTNSVNGNTLTLSWPSGQGWRLVSQTNNLSTGLNTNPAAWSTVSGVSGNSATITIDLTRPTVFYRLVNP